MTEYFFAEDNHVSHVIQKLFPLIIVDQKQIITYVNDLFCELVKYNRTSLINHPLDTISIKPLEQNGRPFIDSQLLDQNKYVEKEIEYKDRNGSVFWATTAMTYLFDKTGNKSHYFIIFSEHVKTSISDNIPIRPLQLLQTLEMAVNESNAVIVTDTDGTILSVNKRYCDLSKFKPEEVIGKTPSVVKSGYQSKEFYEKMWRTILSGEIWSGELKNKAKDGSTYWIHSTTVPILNKSGQPTLFIAIQTDITRRIEAEKSLQRALKNEFNKTVRNLYNIVFKYEKIDGEIKFTLLEGKMMKKLNLSLEKMSMDQIANRHQPNDVKRIEHHFELALKGNATHFEVELYDYSLLIYLSPIFEGDKVIEVVGTIIDITNRKKAENLAKQMAYYDFLTQLPNRRYLQEKAEKFIFQHEMNYKTFALMFIDIDRFKNINDSMGHSAGDQLLVQLSGRLQKIIRKEDFVARLGGDEFIILLPDVTENEAREHAKKIVKHLKQSFKHRNLEIYIRPSIGISMFPTDGMDYDSLLGSADIAMYKNKKQLNADFQFFTQTLRQNILERTLLEMDLQQAIERNQFELYYQPKINLKTNKITGVEALLRWQHPVKGFIPPNKFIPLAEETGAIIQISQWVLYTACKQLKDWLDAGYGPLTMAVNISIVQFNHPTFDKLVKKALDDVGLDAKYLNLEVTESMMLDKERSERTFNRLRKLGVAISIDDFGTGYSSLSYLSNFPITHLKIDQSFIHDFTNSNQAIIETIISLAKALNVKVIAEGVEQQIHEQFLIASQCDEAQGYYYAKPMSASKVVNYL